MRQIQKRGFAEELIGLVNVHDHLMAVIGEPGNLDFAVDHQINAGGGLVLVVDHLAFPVLHDAGAGQMG